MNTFPSFSTVFLSVDQVLPAAWDPILFDIVETDGVNSAIYNSATGEFTAPNSGWYDINVLLLTSVALTGLRIIKNGDINFPIIAMDGYTGTVSNIKTRVKLGLGETLRVEGFGIATIMATSTIVPIARSSGAIFTIVKSFL